MWRASDPQGNECAKIRWELVPYTRGKGLDVGSGPSKPFAHMIAVDNCKDTSLFGIQMQPDVNCDVMDMPIFASGSMDFVFSSHTLEHIEDHVAALREWWRVIKIGGYLCLYLPHKDFYPNIGTDGANPDHKHDFMPADVIEAMKQVGSWDLMENQERNEDMEYSFFQVFQKLEEEHPVRSFKFSCDAPKPEKTCAIVRYGAWGDVVQMSSILPALKAQGYHITLYTVPRAWEAVKHEPLIDRVILQDHEQVPNAWLGEFWASLKKKYDRFINLSESVEAQFLAMPDRIPYQWPHEARHALMNHNYGEMLHRIAVVPYLGKPQSRFVATEDEKQWAAKQREQLDAERFIMWVLSGSAVHKVYPHIDTVLARIMLHYPRTKVITVGDERCQKMIESVWENEPRIVRRSGIWSIRETMTMAYHCDAVIGPETGVMSAVAMEPMPKLVMLSHSSHENLTRDWENTYALFSAKTPCAPCHKLIYNWSQCVRDEETGVSKCMADIPPDAVWHALTAALPVRELEAA